MRRLIAVAGGRGAGAILQLALLYRLSEATEVVAELVTLLIAMGFVSSLLRAGVEFEILRAAAAGRMADALSEEVTRLRRRALLILLAVVAVAIAVPGVGLTFGAAVMLGLAHCAAWIASASFEARGRTLTSALFQGLTLYGSLWVLLPLHEVAALRPAVYAIAAAVLALAFAGLGVWANRSNAAPRDPVVGRSEPRRAIAAMQVTTSGLALLVVWLAGYVFGADAAALFGISQRVTLVLAFGLAAGTWAVARSMMDGIAASPERVRPFEELHVSTFAVPALGLGAAGVLFAAPILGLFGEVPPWGPWVLSAYLAAAAINAATGPVFVYYRFRAGDERAARLVVVAVVAAASVVATALAWHDVVWLAAAPLAYAVVSNLVPLWLLTRTKEVQSCPAR